MRSMNACSASESGRRQRESGVYTGGDRTLLSPRFRATWTHSMTGSLRQLWDMAGAQIRRRLSLLAVLFVIASLLDSFSIVLVFSFFKVIVEPGALEQIAWL